MERVQIEAIFRKHATALVDDIMVIIGKGPKMVPELGDNMQEIPSYRQEMAKRIHGIRSRAARTVEDVAEAAKIPVRTLEQIEAGTYWPKNGQILMDIAHSLGTNAFELDPRFDPGGPLSSVPSSPHISKGGQSVYPERLEDDGKDSDGSG
jgi:DNA-binding XRE family transcriptional regulator